MNDRDITRNGFKYSYGRFYARGQTENIDGAQLKAMLLPCLTPEANRLLRTHYRDLVRGQLQHYGVKYDEREFSGNATLMQAKVLLAGKTAYHPEWVMERYFVDGPGNPDPTKTSEIVGIPYPRFSSYRAGQLHEAVSGIHGIHHATGIQRLIPAEQAQVSKHGVTHPRATAPAPRGSTSRSRRCPCGVARRRGFQMPGSAFTLGTIFNAVGRKKVRGKWDAVGGESVVEVFAGASFGAFEKLGDSGHGTGADWNVVFVHGPIVRVLGGEMATLLRFLGAYG
ncbi:hypothetical protein N657DRAFT_636556 [Parathielavia appendiculata]|uniref:Uncharacterized protein n=1 Tax=Parathielavia appendiculata TaxID=2587402 RepID=A0AAN6Z0P4_9PEZI|nr:hypothetical protein N657DRAFT_636556 [Parathielavia appendiculata]